MSGRGEGEAPAGACAIGKPPDLSALTQVRLQPEPPLADSLEAMALANREAEIRLRDPMLLSWYDRGRDFDSPQHATDCHADGSVPGYVDYGVYHGVSLMVDIEHGRFVFFYLAVDL